MDHISYQPLTRDEINQLMRKMMEDKARRDNVSDRFSIINYQPLTRDEINQRMNMMIAGRVRQDYH